MSTQEQEALHAYRAATRLMVTAVACTFFFAAGLYWPSEPNPFLVIGCISSAVCILMLNLFGA